MLAASQAYLQAIVDCAAASVRVRDTAGWFAALQYRFEIGTDESPPHAVLMDNLAQQAEALAAEFAARKVLLDAQRRLVLAAAEAIAAN